MFFILNLLFSIVVSLQTDLWICAAKIKMEDCQNLTDRKTTISSLLLLADKGLKDTVVNLTYQT